MCFIKGLINNSNPCDFIYAVLQMFKIKCWKCSSEFFFFSFLGCSCSGILQWIMIIIDCAQILHQMPFLTQPYLFN